MLNLSRMILPVDLAERSNLEESDEEEDSYHFQQMYLTVYATLVCNCFVFTKKGFAYVLKC